MRWKWVYLVAKVRQFEARLSGWLQHFLFSFLLFFDLISRRKLHVYARDTWKARSLLTGLQSNFGPLTLSGIFYMNFHLTFTLYSRHSEIVQNEARSRALDQEDVAKVAQWLRRLTTGKWSTDRGKLHFELLTGARTIASFVWFQMGMNYNIWAHRETPPHAYGA